MTYDLEFERPLSKLDEQIHGLRRKMDRLTPEERRRISELECELDAKTRDLYNALTPWQRVQVARHPQRPHTEDYAKLIFDDFFELRGDRRYGNDRAILAGLASLEGQTVMLIGHQKGRDTKERQECNFGSPHPEGFRKAMRVMLQAERLRIPVVTFIDTQGAFPGYEDEQRGQAQAIAENLLVMARLRTPILTVVIGEGGSGGALAIGVADRVLMLVNTYYTVAAPEAAASILWRDARHASEAAAAMKIGAPDLLGLGLIDDIVPEPLGGAHRDHRAAADLLKAVMVDEVRRLTVWPTSTLLDRRYDKLRGVGAHATEAVAVN
jgi:acetyl-CoA carboxylase carboxyl transferase subunit alpha